MPHYPQWKLWLGVGILRGVLFVIAARFLFGYILFVCPEPFLLTHIRIPGGLFLALLVVDTLALGYIVTLVVALFRRAGA
jgi:hypothetical protein